MSRRRDAVERHYEREEERLLRDLREDRITHDEYREAIRELEREARDDLRAAMDEDISDVMDDWRY
jgi:hypothetical protein